MRSSLMSIAASALVALAMQVPAWGQDHPSVSPVPIDYQLGPGDRLRITVYDEAGMTGEYQVSERGIISFPLVGDVAVGGRTVPEVRTGIEQRLGRGLVNNPKVTAEMVSFRPFYILGEVNRPGMYPYTLGLTLYSAVATAQGFTYRANARNVLITHAGQTDEKKVAVTTATRISPGDTIRVREKFF